MLWNVVFEFFVVYVFGGCLNGVYYAGFIGTLNDVESITPVECDTGSFAFEMPFNFYEDNSGISGHYYMPLGNYFSLIATIITMVALILFCAFLVKKIIGVVFRLFSFGA